MESIIQKDKTKCFICKENANGDFLAKHHVYGGALRSKSEKYGFTVYIHNNKCHIFGENAVQQKCEDQPQTSSLCTEKGYGALRVVARRFYQTILQKFYIGERKNERF